MGKHSILSPSGGDRWVPCPGSVAFIRSLITSGVLGEEEEDDDPMSPSNEGTRAHLLLSTSLDNGVCAEEARHIMPEEDLPYITEEMPDHVQGVINWIADYMEENPGTELWVERKVSAEPYTGTKETAGTLDVGLLNFPRKELIVLDFKYGMGVAVHPDDAIQLDIYGLGALAEFNENDFKITTRIIAQPRHPRVDTFQIQRDTTKKFVKRAGKISTAARIALSPGAHLNPLNFEPGEKQCRWCRGSPFCEYLSEMMLDMAVSDFDGDLTQDLTKDHLTNPYILSPVMRSFVQKHVDLFRSWVKSVEGENTKFMKHGGDIAGFKLVHRATQRKFLDDTTPDIVAEALDLPIFKVTERKLLAMTKVETVAKKADKIEDFQRLIVKPLGELMVVPNEDKRAEVSAYPETDPEEDEAIESLLER